jgi:hypothetical protein
LAALLHPAAKQVTVPLALVTNTLASAALMPPRIGLAALYDKQ